MICCALIAFLFAPLLLLARACRGASRDPLAWRLHAPIRPAISSHALSWRARMRSFSFAFAGLAFMLRTQPNAWAHLVATLLVICAGLLLRVSLSDWRWLIAAISSVWMAEAINTAIEHVRDVVSPGFDLFGKARQRHRRRRRPRRRDRRGDSRGYSLFALSRRIDHGPMKRRGICVTSIAAAIHEKPHNDPPSA